MIKQNDWNSTGAYSDVEVFQLASDIAHFLEVSDARIYEMLGDAKASSFMNNLTAVRVGLGSPCLHVCLTMFFRGGVVEFQGSEAGSGHKQECDILDIFDFFLIVILQYDDH